MPKLDTSAVKALFFDIDGTLLSFKTHRICESTVAALRRAHTCGMKIFIATGRHKKNLVSVPELNDIPIDGFIGLNGQYCWDGTGVVYTNPIPAHDVKILLDYVLKSEYGCEFLGVTEYFANRVTPTMKTELDRVAIAYPTVTDNPGRALEIDILQADLYAEAGADFSFLEEMTSCKWSFWGSGSIDIMVSSGGKWNGVQKMMERHGLSLSEVMVFGDEENDVEMLRGASLSVAMGNGCDNAKAAAKHVAGHIDEDGLFFAMRALLPRLSL
ncbi:MAG: Cof-type HAD-IIB family hydrolase [Clostridiaceae bacterium]|nr:Cof-type HAD-IIB family hydrolase [Eubacteriales bacterium]